MMMMMMVVVMVVVVKLHFATQEQGLRGFGRGCGAERPHIRIQLRAPPSPRPRCVER